SSIVLKSPSGKSSSHAFNTRRIILPERVLGNFSLNSISRGAACAANPSLTNLRISSFNSSLSLNSGRRATNALIISPRTGSGLPMTPASATASCSTNFDSSSNGPTRSPAVMITSSTRPWNQEYPSSSLHDDSTETYQSPIKYESYFAGLFQIGIIMDGQPFLIATLPMRLGGNSLPWSSTIDASMPGKGLPIEPNFTSIEG